MPATINKEALEQKYTIAVKMSGTMKPEDWENLVQMSRAIMLVEEQKQSILTRLAWVGTLAGGCK